MMPGQLTIAISKGRILEEALPLLGEIGIRPTGDPSRSRKLILETGRPNIKLVIIRASDVPTYVAHGAADVGIAGKDVLLEADSGNMYEPLDLRIACCRLMLAGPTQPAPVNARLRIATKYVRTAQDYFAAQGRQVEIIKLYGSMELGPLLGLADQIIDLVDTGNTLKANGLVPLQLISEISSRLVVNKAAMKMKRSLLKPFNRTISRHSKLMIGIRELDSTALDFPAKLDALMSSSVEFDETLKRTVSHILQAVRQQGDAAVLEYTNRFDRRRAGIAELEISAAELQAAFMQIPPSLRASLEQAAQRIRIYHEHQAAESWSYEDDDGSLLGQQVTPLDRVGVYVPGGKAAYPSSVLMNVIPAVVAGVAEIIMAVPAPDDELNPLVLAAAGIAGVSRVFSIGGAQAIAALAYGTETIPAVDKIVGPGNRYVAAAKKQVFGRVGIDMIAGPSEVLIVSDGSGRPDWVAMDMFAQAEHDEDARAILLCPDHDFITSVKADMVRTLAAMERKEIIRQSLERHGAFIRVRDLDDAIQVANKIAPEHLQLSVAAPKAMLKQIRHAGAIFMGHYSAEALGDYCAGPNHVLPTGRSSRFSSPLGVYDFQKRSSIIMCSESSASSLAMITSKLARSEGLTAHARSVELRIKKN